MSTFNITSSKVNKTFELSNENIHVNGSYVCNEQTGEMQSVQGNCYRNDADGGNGDYIGNFSGAVRNGDIRYSLSEMNRRDSLMVWDAIDEIEQHIITNE